jgi:hypothetical protein
MPNLPKTDHVRNWKLLLEATNPMDRMPHTDSSSDAICLFHKGKVLFLYPDGTWDIDDTEDIEDDRE